MGCSGGLGMLVLARLLNRTVVLIWNILFKSIGVLALLAGIYMLTDTLVFDNWFFVEIKVFSSVVVLVCGLYLIWSAYKDTRFMCILFGCEK